MENYQFVKDPFTGETSTSVILRLTDNAYIPFDPRNVDYQAYLAWVAKGNTAQPAA